ncbi:aminoglycoside phosphotransferase family protein [Microbacterium fluvii]|uniref:Aminoglycoside phosphotransferase family protein n=1 Tax=Microbacterium fluvii TaxID=415215 RepID=A0ABW2HFG1_9MICO|nr:aminoglycoside phosphotransferase family protein [Microbacterium fluvii]MCU4672137.1 aminoglycoside phosphotransferase family protein [Microbacterium fluvii]
MPDKPTAEVVVDETLVRALLRDQCAELSGAPLHHAADGWDCSVWRVGDRLAVRLPRRAAAADLIAHEQTALAIIGPQIEQTGVRVPLPLVHGRPTAGYPWSWSVVPWITGMPGLAVAREQRRGWASSLAAALRALHRPALADAPVNPVRGRPLATRDEAVSARFEAARRRGSAAEEVLTHAQRLWRDAVETPDWSAPPVWIHGDLHPGNLVAMGGRLVGVIDFGDVTGGDPAYDLAVAWLAFDAAGRTLFRAELPGVDEATWVRARGWAAAVAVLLLEHSDDNEPYRLLGSEALAELVCEP